MSDPDTGNNRSPRGTGCGSVLLVLLGLVMLLPGVCVIALSFGGPRLTLAQWASQLWEFRSFLMISAGGVVVIVLAVQQSTRR